MIPPLSKVRKTRRLIPQSEGGAKEHHIRAVSVSKNAID
jgi:hypothetical protein